RAADGVATPLRLSTAQPRCRSPQLYDSGTPVPKIARSLKVAHPPVPRRELPSGSRRESPGTRADQQR
ncbi:hypothetical protein ACWEGQ_22525, partial [Streptomyces seoulensis]